MRLLSKNLWNNYPFLIQISQIMSHKMAALKSFCEITQKFFQRRSLEPETISGYWKPWKNHEKYFLFHLNELNLLLRNQILLILCIFIKPNVWYLWSLKILAIKRWFPFNFAKILQGRHFVVGGPKIQTFSRHFFWELPSKYCIVEFTAIFVCFLLSWSRRYSMKWSSNFDGP